MSFPICGLGDGCCIRRILIISILILHRSHHPYHPNHTIRIIPRGLAGGEYARLREGAGGAGLLEFKELVC